MGGGGLEIIDTNIYDYIITYSFPCQDLSCAGKMEGMLKGSGTRSGLLWEVERLLNETKNLPQILLMENVPLIHSEDNLDAFQEWQRFLESKGYKNYWQDLIASDFGIPQSRKRTYMISLLGEYSYIFPKPTMIKCTISLLLEKEVDKKYYLSLEEIKRIKSWNSIQKPLERITFLCDLCPTLIARDNGVEKAECGSTVIIYDMKGLRYLTSVEKARLMGFKDDMVYQILQSGVSERQLQRQLGNGIVVTVLEEIFKQFFKEEIND